jgi:hypothetical protein
MAEDATQDRAALAKALYETLWEYFPGLPNDHENWLSWADEILSRLEDDDE